jgi:purine nucleosidase
MPASWRRWPTGAIFRWRRAPTAQFIHGENGLANVELAVPGCAADPRFGPDVIIELVRKHPGEIVLLPVGPLTNIALAALKDPSIVPMVKEVVLMGGSLSGGNASAAAEANIHGDPEAAQIVFEAGWPVTMVGLDVTEKTVFTSSYLAELSETKGPQNDFAAALLKAMIERLGQYGREGMSMHDPLAVGAVIDSTLITTECYPVNVETRGELTRGETVADRRGWEKAERCAKVALGVESDRFIRLFVERLRGK